MLEFNMLSPESGILMCVKAIMAHTMLTGCRARSTSLSSSHGVVKVYPNPAKGSSVSNFVNVSRYPDPLQIRI
jgi:hypothetical protein